MSQEIRVRFAPSPTGALHIGGVRTALYNYLFARKNGGKMILRIEDTDQSRYVPWAEKYIKESLDWVGIEVDESPEKGGPYGPYRQSERKDLYAQYAKKLLDEGNAYYAFDTPEELDAMRERLKAARVASPQYNSVTRMEMKNSLTLPEDEVKAKLEAGEPYVIRLKVPRKEEIRLNDMVRGWVMVHSSAIDDKVLMKSDGMPTYHLANVVDDHLMKITHVIRGEEWLPSAPLHVLLYRFLGWESTMPQFAHLPLILKPDGNGKLSKRDADQHGFPVFPLSWEDKAEQVSGFKESGYLPEATLNFLSLLGWSPGNNEEMFDKEALIENFTIERIGKAGTKFDIDKAKWFNQQYLKRKSNAELAVNLSEQLAKVGIEVEQSVKEAVCNELKERAVFLNDLWEMGSFFFVAPLNYDEKVAKNKWKAEAVKVLEGFSNKLDSETEILTADKAKALFEESLNQEGVKMGKVMQSLRLAITGLGSGPDLMNLMEILGSSEVSQRIKRAIEELKVQA
ncbi:MAG: glutamate--tRNA ligase [Cyclobacteriaceae bacterium]|nr:glutamate--tRNA ligase [Cyclobacteriaceae bacterium]MCH8516632.1 glutamate--tRNA ligase [Cyclobacteriaceae bacterium]